MSLYSGNQIDEEIFTCLTNEDIKELIPILGLRKKFIKKYNIYMKISDVSSNFYNSVYVFVVANKIFLTG